MRPSLARSLRLRLTVVAALGAALAACPSDAGAHLDAPPVVNVAWLSVRLPVARAMLASVPLAPAEPALDGGFAIQPAPRTAGPRLATSGAWRRDASAVRAELPAASGGTMRVRAGTGPTIGVRRLGASGDSGVLDGGAVVYAGGASGIDVVVFARGASVEELLVVKGGQGAVEYELELPAGYTLLAPAPFPGLVEARDPDGRARLRMRVDRAWDARGREIPVRVSVEGRRMRIAWDAVLPAPVIVDPLWEATDGMVLPRYGHTATLLPSGRVLVAGGGTTGGPGLPLQSAEIFDPSTRTFTAVAAQMSYPRASHSASLLPNGKVLLVSAPGVAGLDAGTSSDLFDPATGTFAPGPVMSAVRMGGTATTLPSGDVLLAGGYGSGGPPTTIDLYHVATGMIESAPVATTDTGPGQTATLLASGDVLLTGGLSCAGASGCTAVARARVYHNATKIVSLTGSMMRARSGHRATLLPDGRVLIVGDVAQPLATTEIYDPAAGSFTPGPVLTSARLSPISVVLPSGDVLVGGGWLVDSSGTFTGVQASAEIYSPGSASFAAVADMASPRVDATATLLATGEILVAGGTTDPSSHVTSSAEVLDPASAGGSFAPGATMSVARVGHTATVLPSGKVLVAGGCGSVTCGPGNDLSTAELFDPATASFGAAPSMNEPRGAHTATLLLSGQVLVAGGFGTQQLDTAELYDPAAGGAGAFLATGKMLAPRAGHIATLLDDGRVLVDGGGPATAEIYDPSTGQFSATAGGAATYAATATRLFSGKVLYTGGAPTFGGPLWQGTATAHVFDPATGAATPAGGMIAPRAGHSATLLGNGHVLIVGGTEGAGGAGAFAASEVFDPDAAGGVGVFTPTIQTQIAFFHTATPLPSGKILLAGAARAPASPGATQLYDPASDTVLDAAGLSQARQGAAATLLPSGRVLVAGGADASGTPTATTELWDAGARFTDSSRPALGTVPGAVGYGDAIALTGVRLTGRGDATGGTSATSSTSYPIALWFPLAGGGAQLGTLTPWTATSATWTVPTWKARGWGYLFAVADGIPSVGSIVRVGAAVAAHTCGTDSDCAAGHCVDGVCCDSSCVGPCVACSAAKKGHGADGVCETVLAGQNPDGDCTASDPTTCGQTGTCDGAGACSLWPDGTDCGTDAKCSKGVCAQGNPCLGAVDGTACGDGGTCRSGLCTATTGSATCDGDHALVLDGGVTLDCAPYGCRGTACKSSCASTGDCASGFVCHADNRCAVAAGPRSDDSASGCGCRAAPSGAFALRWVLAALVSWGYRRRRRVGVAPR